MVRGTGSSHRLKLNGTRFVAELRRTAPDGEAKTTETQREKKE